MKIHSRRARTMLAATVLPTLVVLLVSPLSAQAFEADIRPLAPSQGSPGERVAIHGDWAVLGGQFGQTSAGYHASLHLYDAQSESWNHQLDLEPSAAPGLTCFGSSVDIGSDLIVVGDGFYGYGPGSFPGDGEAFAWYRDPATGDWLETPPLKPAGLASNEYFGCDVAVDGLEVVIGAYRTGIPNPVGAAYILRFNPGSWSWQLQATLSPSVPSEYMDFGRRVDMQGGRVWVSSSATLREPESAVDMFQQVQGQWVHQQRISQPPPFFALDLSLDGDLGAVVGAGQLFALRAGPNGLFQIEENLTALSKSTFRSVSVSAGRIAAGAPFDGDGMVSIFDRPACSGGAWTETHALRTVHKVLGSSNPDFGCDVAIHNDRIVGGMPDHRPQAFPPVPILGGAGAFVLPADCDGNGIADSCEIAAGAADVDQDGVLDACEAMGTRYCSPNTPNSTGVPGYLLVEGSNEVANNRIVFSLGNLPPNQFALMLVSRDSGFLPGAGGAVGDLCLGGNIGRLRPATFLPKTEADGRVFVFGDLTSIPLNPATPIIPGDTLYFQAWHRDGTQSNFSDAVEVTFN